MAADARRQGTCSVEIASCTEALGPLNLSRLHCTSDRCRQRSVPVTAIHNVVNDAIARRAPIPAGPPPPSCTRRSLHCSTHIPVLRPGRCMRIRQRITHSACRRMTDQGRSPSSGLLMLRDLLDLPPKRSCAMRRNYANGSVRSLTYKVEPLTCNCSSDNTQSPELY